MAVRGLWPPAAGLHLRSHTRPRGTPLPCSRTVVEDAAPRQAMGRRRIRRRGPISVGGEVNGNLPEGGARPLERVVAVGGIGGVKREDEVRGWTRR
jgi:hypothetical protein